MAEKTIATFRMDSNQKAHLQALAEKVGCTFTDIVTKALQTAVPLPPIVKDTLKDLSRGSGIPPGELLNLICIDWQARNFVEQQKFGQLLSNPFWKIGPKGFLEDHDELYLFLKQRYEKTLDDILNAGNGNKK